MDDIAALFAPDGRLEFASTGRVANGRAEIQNFFRQAFAARGSADGAASTHLMTNTVVDPGDAEDQARLHTSAVAFHATADKVVGRGLTYTDACIRVGASWLLVDRIHRLHWQATMPGGAMSTDAPPM